MTDNTRCLAALLGLALGDSMGQPTEFSRGERVRTMTIHTTPGRFRWTDDTHMAMYLGAAILKMPTSEWSDRDLENFGDRVGEEWVTWLSDPARVGTAPGGTCTAGAMAYANHRDWQRSGVRSSDGCGAVMRIAPLALALEPSALLRAAHIQAVTTHAHPNAPAGATAGAFIHAQALEYEGTDQRQEFQRWILGGAEAAGTKAPTVIGALKSALGVGDGDFDWLPEAEIPAGDGGWRTPSALGLALAACLRWGFEDGVVTPASFDLAVEKAARIDGDSDSVACLVGMYLGALGGLSVVQAHPGYAAIRDREVIEELAERLWAWRSGETPTAFCVKQALAKSREVTS